MPFFSLKIKKSPGYDQISLLKSLEKEIFLDDLKVASVIPVFGGGDRSMDQHQ